jgi:hypothetical protein
MNKKGRKPFALPSSQFSSIPRRRTQDTIDRRFYRRKYNAEQTIAKFNETLRDEVDLETLKANLVNVVQETLEPSSIRIWIKEPSEK